MIAVCVRVVCEFKRKLALCVCVRERETRSVYEVLGAA